MGAVSSQAALLASGGSQGVAASSQLSLLAGFAPPATFAVRNSQLMADIAFGEEGIPASSQTALLVAYKTGAPDDLTSRAWTFDLDGHTFYVVTLGEQGTFVYDQSTKQWCKWQTDGLTSWNMENGTVWRGKIIAADRQNPIAWELDPSSFIDDDFKPQTRKSTGSISTRMRQFIPNYGFTITASKGESDVPLTAPPTLATVQLRFSDDQGRTFVDAGTITVDEGNLTQVLQWLSLGQIGPPQRVFEITDVGAMTRLSGADADLGEEDL